MKNIYLTLLIFMACFSAYAQQLPFQGYLEESSLPVNGTRDFQFDLPNYGWTETFTAVPVSNGIYNIVLGSTTPLPSTIFQGVSETPMDITVNGLAIGTITLYKPLLNANSLVGSGENMTIVGPNDSTNITLGSSADGYYGNIGIFDSLGISNGFLRARNSGGYLQLNKLDGSGNFSSAITASTSNATSSLSLWGQNTAANNITSMITSYISGNQIDNGPAMSGNYKRSGTDYKDNNGQIFAAIGNTRDETGTDPTGTSGFLSLWGTNSFNVELTGKRWENNDLPLFQLFGNNDNGAGFWSSNIGLEVRQEAGTANSGSINLYNTDNGGISTDGLFLTSNLFGNGGGGIEVKDSSAAATINLNGQNGSISLLGPGGTPVTMFQNTDGSGGIAIQDAGNFGRLFFNALDGNFILRDGTETETARIVSETGDIVVTGTVTAAGTLLTSDKRLKKKITPLDNSLQNTLKLRGTSYYWKDENKSQKRQIGVIAQEVEEVYPEFVHTNDEGFKSVNYAQMTAVLIEAVKELNTKIAKLENQNKELSAALQQQASLDDRLGKLEKMLLENEKVAAKK